MTGRGRLPFGRASLARFALIFFLYMAQGTATGFLVAGLPAVLREQGMPLEILWVAFLPPIFYSVKFLWAPLADRHWLPALGRRRTWLIPATLGVALGFLLLARFPPDRGLAAATVVLLFIGLAGANMDIATDAYAVEILHPVERGLGNGLQSAGLSAGVMIGEGAMLILVDRFGWAWAMTALGLLIPMVAVPGLLRREPPPPAEALAADGTPAGLGAFFRRPEAPLMLVLALLTGLCYYLLGPILGPFLVDRGLSLTEIGAISLAGMFAGIAGAVIGGGSVNLLGFRRAFAAILAGGLLFALVAFWLATREVAGIAALGPAMWLGRFLLGAAFAVFYANVMNWCSQGQAATDYTMISSVYSATAVIGGSLAGLSAGRLGYGGHFLAVAAFHAFSLGGLAVLHPRITAGAARALGVAERDLIGVPRGAAHGED
jgi:MFS transporter (putative signal transducer)